MHIRSTNIGARITLASLVLGLTMPAPIFAATQYILSTASYSAGSNQTWNVPSDFNAAANTVECIGGGASGGACGGGSFSNCAGAGGGGGAYAAITNFSPSGGTVTFRIGAKGNGVSDNSGNGKSGFLGGDTWFATTSTTTVSFTGSTDNSACYAQGGQPGSAGQASATPGAGGLVAKSWGALARYAGGSGGTDSGGSGTATGGGGAAGKHGAGNQGATRGSSFGSSNGGSGDNGDASGGSAGLSSGGAGGNGAEYGSPDGSGGGGGGYENFSSGTGGAGGQWGAGGGGSAATNNGQTATSGAGTNGIIVIRTPPIGPSRHLLLFKGYKIKIIKGS